MKNKPFFPMFIDLSDKKVLIVGGGVIATRRIKTLLAFTRKITVVAPQVSQDILEMAKVGQITLLQRPVRRSDFTDIYMALAATNDRKLNDDIYRICKAEGIYVNVSSDREKCDFYFPGVFMEENMVVGVTASGLDHRKARIARIAIQEALEKVAGESEEHED
ncbi:MAG: bifunctional precorrin-2 dehydrogenase/sirohydrochlorin ferrochelatase [Eubacteriales bacterium]|nr:bifunctional precorrin-2 dehydrogenase/sirohydrochlorin ferrochelatase [Eubacteriales bacterium]